MPGENRKSERDDNLTALFNMVRSMQESFGELRSRFEHHMTAEEAHYTTTNEELIRVGDELRKVSKLVKAFPHVEGEPDIEGHCNYHTRKIENAAISTKRWNGVLQSVLEWAAKGLATAVFFLLLLGAKDYFQQPQSTIVSTTTSQGIVGAK